MTKKKKPEQEEAMDQHDTNMVSPVLMEYTPGVFKPIEITRKDGKTEIIDAMDTGAGAIVRSTLWDKFAVYTPSMVFCPGTKVVESENEDGEIEWKVIPRHSH